MQDNATLNKNLPDEGFPSEEKQHLSAEIGGNYHIWSVREKVVIKLEGEINLAKVYAYVGVPRNQQ